MEKKFRMIETIQVIFRACKKMLNHNWWKDGKEIQNDWDYSGYFQSL